MKNNTKKGLQKLTQFDKLNTLKEIKDFLKTNPDKKTVSKLKFHLEKKINESYLKKEGNENKFIDMTIECLLYLKQHNDLDFMRHTVYEINNQKITISIQKFASKYFCFPTVSWIAEDSGLSRNTVHKHLKKGLKNDFNSLVKGKIDHMTLDAMAKLYVIGTTQSNVNALKSFIELSDKLKEKPPNTVNNLIQINNLKITNEDLKNLPQETIIEIERLIKNNIFVNEKTN
ncbi:helix-turn-helix domain-containing protein [uncultured Tenacibaculum sp.]|uniref:helix-turn-helix domain-containing protein n=1 Tax=uncultured Tenacibaculum sp. TaxID=174713 RepID=UPI002601F876|nr:helix-turn-helix domain-containing protein [uncultured Tenacibaculum sp.]